MNRLLAIPKILGYLEKGINTLAYLTKKKSFATRIPAPNVIKLFSFIAGDEAK
jgi:hypothetical protein